MAKYRIKFPEYLPGWQNRIVQNLDEALKVARQNDALIEHVEKILALPAPEHMSREEVRVEHERLHRVRSKLYDRRGRLYMAVGIYGGDIWTDL